MADVSVTSETEEPHGWTFTCRVGDRDVRLTLAFADYNLWSAAGHDRPSAVAEAVLRFLADREDDLPARLDASSIRRRYPDADESIPSMIPDG